MSGLSRRRWLAIDYTDTRDALDAGMVRALLAGTLGLTLVGVIEWITGAEVQPWVLPVGSFVLAAWCGWMLWTGRPRAMPVLLAASAFAVAYIIDTALHPERGDLTDTTPIVILTAVAVILVTATRQRVRLIIAWLALFGAMVITIQIAADNNQVAVFTETAASLIVLGLALFMVAESHRSIEASKRRYDRLLEAAPIGVVEMDISRTRAMVEELGLSAEQLRERLRTDDTLALRLSDSIVGVHVNRLLLNFAGAGTVEHAQRRFQKGGALPEHRDFLVRFVVDTVLLGANSEYVLPLGSDRYTLARWWLDRPGDDRVTALLVDITAQKRVEASLSGEIHMKNRFIASVSHELRTPLTAVVGLIEELTDSPIGFEEEERQELLEIIAKQARDVAGIVEDLLVAARTEGGELTIASEPFDVGELLHSTVPTYGNAGQVDAPDGLTAIGDPGRVRQILRNLLTNAARYGGDTQRVVAHNSGRTVKIEVRDSGSPIPQAEQVRMFQPYERAHQRPGRPESVGLGLTVSRDLARMMDGDLSYHHDGRESVFMLELPAA